MSTATYARVRVNATSANIGPGFDVLGLCLDSPADVIEVTTDPGEVEVRGRVATSTIPRERRANCATVALAAALKGDPKRVEDSLRWGVRLTKGIPVAGGLGGSAASAVGGALAGWALRGPEGGRLHACRQRDAVANDQILTAALVGEAVAAGAAHLDNVAPALLGGLVAVASPRVPQGPPVVARLPIAPWWLATVTPLQQVSTAHARVLLPKTVPLVDSVAATARSVLLTHALACGDSRLLSEVLEDPLATPARSHLFPWLAVAQAAAVEAGAPALVISGSGPTVVALLQTRAHARSVARQTAAAIVSTGVDATSSIHRVGGGARIEAFE